MINELDISGLEAAIKKMPSNTEDVFALGDAYFQAGRYSDLLGLYERMMKMNLSGVDLATALSYKGVAHVCLCNWEEAVAAFVDTLEVLEKLPDEEEEVISLKGFNYYDLSTYCEDTDKGEEYAAKALEYLTMLAERFPEYPHLIKVYAHLADLHHSFDDSAMALQYYDLFYQLGQGTEDGVWALSGMAGVYGAMGDHQKAMLFFNRALDAANSSVPITKIYYDMGEMHFQFNKLPEAEAALKTALKFKDLDPILGPNDEYEFSILWRLGTIAYDLENDDEMLGLFEDLLTRIDNDHIYYADINLRLGHYYAAAFRYSTSARHYNQVLLTPIATAEETMMAKNCLLEMPLSQNNIIQ